jgi:IS30 family transposase
MRRSKPSSLKGQGLGKIVYAVSISERPASLEECVIAEHWQADLRQGSKNAFIATLVERHSRYVMFAKVENKNTDTVVNAFIKPSKKLPTDLYKCFTCI